MNIFHLDESLETSAKYHCDQHLLKMILEHAQMISTAKRFYGEDAPYKSTHENHPCTLWTKKSKDNFTTLMDFTNELNKEYNVRYGRNHRSWDKIKDLQPPKKMPDIGLTEAPICMFDYCKKPSLISSYRNYYVENKVRFAKWEKTKTPDWFSMYFTDKKIIKEIQSIFKPIKKQFDKRHYKHGHLVIAKCEGNEKFISADQANIDYARPQSYFISRVDGGKFVGRMRLDGKISSFYYRERNKGIVCGSLEHEIYASNSEVLSKFINSFDFNK